MEKNRYSILSKEIKRSNTRIIKVFQKEIDWVEKHLDILIEETPDWNKILTILLSVKGVGKVLAYTLLSDLPELGQLNKKEIAALVGVAPINRESELYKGKRTVLFMAMMSTIKSNPRLSVIINVLLPRGTQERAPVASMRKMFTTLNVMVKTEQCGMKSWLNALIIFASNSFLGISYFNTRIIIYISIYIFARVSFNG